MMRILFSAVSFLLLFVSCRHVPRPGTFEATGLKIGKVTVAINDKALNSEELEKLSELGAAVTVEKAAMEYVKHGLRCFDESSNYTLSYLIDVTGFRNRWAKGILGIFSGGDSVSAAISIMDGDNVVAQTRYEETRYDNDDGTKLLIGLAKRGALEVTREVNVNVIASDTVPPAAQTVAPLATQIATAAPNKTSAITAKASKKCDVNQILAMKEMKLTNDQIKLACEN